MQETGTHKVMSAIREEALIRHTNQAYHLIRNGERIPITQKRTHVLTHAFDECQQQIFKCREQVRSDSV